MKQLIQEQEDMIDEISSGVQRLNDMAHTIQDEIRNMIVLSMRLKSQIDVSQTKLEHNRRQVERFLHTNSGIKEMCNV